MCLQNLLEFLGANSKLQIGAHPFDSCDAHRAGFPAAWVAGLSLGGGSIVPGDDDCELTLPWNPLSVFVAWVSSAIHISETPHVDGRSSEGAWAGKRHTV